MCSMDFNHISHLYKLRQICLNVYVRSDWNNAQYDKLAKLVTFQDTYNFKYEEPIVNWAMYDILRLRSP